MHSGMRNKQSVLRQSCLNKAEMLLIKIHPASFIWICLYLIQIYTAVKWSNLFVLFYANIFFFLWKYSISRMPNGFLNLWIYLEITASVSFLRNIETSLLKLKDFSARTKKSEKLLSGKYSFYEIFRIAKNRWRGNW